MQALVIAHAAFGHNHFFKNNYQFVSDGPRQYSGLPRLRQKLYREL